MQQDMQDVLVPIAVFSKIDAGQNPQMYSRECMERVIAHNEVVRGKLDSLRRFRHLLMLELSRRFPGEMANYRSLRDDADPQQGFQPSFNDNPQTGGSSSDPGLEPILPPTR